MALRDATGMQSVIWPCEQPVPTRPTTPMTRQLRSRQPYLPWLPSFKQIPISLNNPGKGVPTPGSRTRGVPTLTLSPNGVEEKGEGEEA